MKKIALLLAFSSTLFIGAQTSFALDRGGVDIKGKVSQTAKVENAFNIGIGENVRAVQRMATIGGGNVTIGNEVKQELKVDNAFNIGIGSKVTSCQEVAAVGDSGC